MVDEDGVIEPAAREGSTVTVAPLEQLVAPRESVTST
jgi:hypothetical protein